MDDKQIELLMDIKNEDGYYELGGTIYDRDGHIVETGEEIAKAIKQIEG